jgi:hypothetical protein
MSCERKYIRALANGKHQLFVSTYFMTRKPIGVVSYGGRTWRCDKQELTTIKELNDDGYVRQDLVK